MQIDPAFVGLELKEYQAEVSARRAMNFAAAVGDANPRYFDDERQGGAQAPPMLAVALTWPVTANIWDYLPDPDFPTHLLLTQVHYSEHLAFHAALRPAQRLRIQGRIAAILPHRAGTRVVLRYDAIETSGAPIFTEHIGGLLRGVTCVGEGRGQADLPAVPAAPQGDPLWEGAIPIDPLASYVYDGCTDLHFPIHTSPQFAHQVGLPGIILQGTAALAHAARRLLDAHAAGDPARLRQLACRFAGLVRPGSQINLRLLAEDPRPAGTDLFFDLRNADGAPAIKNGYARIV